MRNNAKRSVSVTAMSAGAVRNRVFGLGIVLAMSTAMSSAMAAGQPASDGVVRFTGSLVDLYDVTLDAPVGALVDAGQTADGGATATLRFDAHGRRLPGAQVALVKPDGAAVRATWRDAHTERSVPLAPGRVHRVGPYGGVMTVAADEATGAVAPVVIHIRHP
ncbi:MULTISPECIES: thioesterase [Burkholderia cepacia complex]|uniref:thioesterase n=1 Tax=Burkholderia cepacia complex TaxID=87882 RepID=UPI000980A8E9|nr:MULTISPECIES: thioesterase [Burkholderia cepacia complex]AQQ24917.1 thioesterase [Burkholderia cenocepacia]MBK1819810.1 thioesterase [Burkholderia orbicola]MBR8087776.1 thioesterase [Burkholderia cenocepacia]ONV88331.1 thioesterase [Burkholderia cenocepacia]ONW15007.1 thioesterase [Burkholderia cenocepacia]